jgi:hypothetical protein
MKKSAIIILLFVLTNNVNAQFKKEISNLVNDDGYFLGYFNADIEDLININLPKTLDIAVVKAFYIVIKTRYSFSNGHSSGQNNFLWPSHIEAQKNGKVNSYLIKIFWFYNSERFPNKDKKTLGSFFLHLNDIKNHTISKTFTVHLYQYSD